MKAAELGIKLSTPSVGETDMEELIQILEQSQGAG